MHDLCEILRRVLEGDEGVFIDNKDDRMANKVKRFKNFRLHKSKGRFYKGGNFAGVKLSQA